MQQGRGRYFMKKMRVCIFFCCAMANGVKVMHAAVSDASPYYKESCAYCNYSHTGDFDMYGFPVPCSREQCKAQRQTDLINHLQRNFHIMNSATAESEERE